MPKKIHRVPSKLMWSPMVWKTLPSCHQSHANNLFMRNYHWDQFDSKLMKGINLYIHRNTFHGSVREQESFLELLHNNFLTNSKANHFPEVLLVWRIKSNHSYRFILSIPFILNSLGLGECICLMASTLSWFFVEILCTLLVSYL